MLVLRRILWAWWVQGSVTDNVKPGGFKRQHLDQMVDEILDLVYSYAGRISVAEAVGVLEICKRQIMENNPKDD